MAKISSCYTKCKNIFLPVVKPVTHSSIKRTTSTYINIHIIQNHFSSLQFTLFWLFSSFYAFGFPERTVPIIYLSSCRKYVKSTESIEWTLYFPSSTEPCINKKEQTRWTHPFHLYRQTQACTNKHIHFSTSWPLPLPIPCIRMDVYVLFNT